MRRFIPYFTDLRDPADVLYWPLQAATIKALPGEAKVSHLRELLTATSRLRRTDSNLAHRSERDLQQALLDWDAVSEAVAVTIITEMSGSQVNREIYSYARSWLADKARNPDRELLTVLGNLGDRVPESPPELAELAEGNRKIAQFLKLATSDKIGEARTRSLAIKIVCEADPTVVKLRAAEVIDALSYDRDLAADVFARFPSRGKLFPVPELITVIAGRFVGLTELEDRVQCALWLFHIYTHPHMPSRRATRLSKELREFLSVVTGASGAKNAEKWRAEVRERLGHDDLRDKWDELFPKHGLNWTLRS